MYKTSKQVGIVRPTSFSNGKRSNFATTGRRFKPLSYYILGGVDLSGKQLSCDAQLDYQTEEANSAIDVPMENNPRVGFFEAAEIVGVDFAMEQDSKRNANVSNVVTSPSDQPEN